MVYVVRKQGLSFGAEITVELWRQILLMNCIAACFIARNKIVHIVAGLLEVFGFEALIDFVLEVFLVLVQWDEQVADDFD